jgi:hypothetical protein
MYLRNGKERRGAGLVKAFAHPLHRQSLPDRLNRNSRQRRKADPGRGLGRPGKAGNLPQATIVFGIDAGPARALGFCQEITLRMSSMRNLAAFSMTGSKWLRTSGWVAVAIAMLAGGNALMAQRPMRPGGPMADAGAPGHLWISATPLDDQRQLLIVIDPTVKNAAIYHVDGGSGTLALKSTRDISWDLMVGDFNALEPKPSALKRMLEVGAEAGPIGQNRP